MKKADKFNPANWLVENKITFQSRLDENNNNIPEGWSENKINPGDQDSGLYGGKLIKSYSAPMEGWDENHEDYVNIIEKEDGTYSLNVYVAFSGDDETEGNKVYQTYDEAHERAVEIMEEFKEDWK